MAILRFQGAFRWLSNFAPARVRRGGIEFGSVEAAYQSAKCCDTADALAFQALSPGAAKRRSRSIKIRSDWDSVKDEIMRDLLSQKFAKSPYRDLLLSTGDAHIEEGNYWGDTYWGVCNGVGENRLGKLIMDVRSQLKAESPR